MNKMRVQISKNVVVNPGSIVQSIFCEECGMDVPSGTNSRLNYSILIKEEVPDVAIVVDSGCGSDH